VVDLSEEGIICKAKFAVWHPLRRLDLCCNSTCELNVVDLSEKHHDDFLIFGNLLKRKSGDDALHGHSHGHGHGHGHCAGM
jgi:hypothetical protein